MRGSIDSISRGGGFLPCGGNKGIHNPGANKLVFIDDSRKIIVCDPEESF